MAFTVIDISCFLYSYPSPIPTMSTQEFFCDCPARCKTRKKVSRSTYYNHSKFRLGQHTGLDYNAFAATHGIPSGVPQADLHSTDQTDLYHPTEAGYDLQDDIGTSHASQSRDPGHTMRPRLQSVGDDDPGGLRDPVNDGRDGPDSGGEVCWHIKSFSPKATHCDPNHCRLRMV